MPKLSAAVAAARRAHILRAAFRCFARSGFARTSMLDLYREAGVSAGSVYTWFRSKEEIIETTYRENTVWATDTIAQLTRERDAVSGLAEIVHLVAELFDQPEWQDESRVNVQVWGEALTNERLREAMLPAFDTYRQLMAAAVERAQATGRISASLQPLAVAQVVWGLVLGLEAQKAWDPRLDAHAYAQAATTMLTGTLIEAKLSTSRSRNDVQRRRQQSPGPLLDRRGHQQRQPGGR